MSWAHPHNHLLARSGLWTGSLAPTYPAPVHNHLLARSGLWTGSLAPTYPAPVDTVHANTVNCLRRS